MSGHDFLISRYESKIDIKRFRVKAGVNPITIRVEDEAGNQAQATLNWRVVWWSSDSWAADFADGLRKYAPPCAENARP